ncbi:hypothetical protein F66182_8120 [Fusarium sp. NRRL 66182]|nr:hypothetical protein F66182_8120 [Fusarium sp. NRRL 66182]
MGCLLPIRCLFSRRWHRGHDSASVGKEPRVTFAFFNLPIEIRIEIYTLLLVDDKTIEISPFLFESASEEEMARHSPRRDHSGRTRQGFRYSEPGIQSLSERGDDGDVKAEIRPNRYEPPNFAFATESHHLLLSPESPERRG